MKSTETETNQARPLQLAESALAACSADLQTLAEGCCMPGRSVRMNEAIAHLKQTMDNILKNGAEPALVAARQKEVEEFGAMIGALHVSCCTPVRAKLYQSILTGLAKAHLNLSVAAGTGH